MTIFFIKNKKIMPYVMALFFLLSSISCSSRLSLSSVNYNEQGVPAYGDAIIVGTTSDASNLIPFIASDGSSHQVSGLIFNGLVKFDKDLNLVGDLAESWDVLDEGLTIVFHLRKNVRWHDGYPFTAKDVLFTYQKIIDPKVLTPYSGDFQRVESVEIIDDYTVKITYPYAFSPAVQSWGMGMVPEHLLKDEDLNTTEFSRNPIGTGPYKFKEWKSMEQIELEAFDEYFEGRPYIDRCIFRVIPDQASMFLEMLTGGIDQVGLTPLQFARQTETKEFKRAFNKYQYPSFTYSYIGFNLTLPMFEDVRVRKAIDYAIDKQEIIDTVVMGLGRPCFGPFYPLLWANNPDIVVRKYSQDNAKQLLEEAGWMDRDNDGIREKDDAILSFTLLVPLGSENAKMLAEIIQHKLLEIGIEVKIRVIEWSTFLTEFIEKRRFEAVIMAWSLTPDPDIYDIWHSSKTGPRDFNFMGYANSEVDILLEEGRRTFGKEKRTPIYQKIHELIYNDCPSIFLYSRDNTLSVHKRFKGVEVTPAGIGHNFIKWYVPEKQQKYTESGKE